MRIRPAQPGTDAPAVAAIYRPMVEDTHISFEETAPDPAEMESRMRRTLRDHPWLVAEEDDGGVAGYAYANAHRERAAYRWSVDISAYVDPRYRGQGIGRLLYDELLEILADRVISTSTPASPSPTRPPKPCTGPSGCNRSACTRWSATSWAGGGTWPGTGCA